MSPNDFKKQVVLNLSMMQACPICGQKPTIKVEQKRFSANHWCVEGTFVATRQHSTWKRDEVAADWNAWCALLRGLKEVK